MKDHVDQQAKGRGHLTFVEVSIISLCNQNLIYNAPVGGFGREQPPSPQTQIFTHSTYVATYHSARKFGMIFNFASWQKGAKFNNTLVILIS